MQRFLYLCPHVGNYKAIVLHALKYGETRVIVDVFTKTAGRVSLIASLPKTQKARLKKQDFQPMTLLEITYEEHQRAQLAKTERRPPADGLVYHTFPG